MSGHLDGKAAIVTGAGRGLGRAIAMALAGEGARVIVNDLGVELDGSGRSQSHAESVVREIRTAGGEAAPSFADVSSFAATEEMVKQCVALFGSIDIIVHNAGILRHTWVYEMTEQDFDAVVAVHLKGCFNLTRHACGPMIRQGWGRIINVASGAGLSGLARHSNYCAAKGGMLAFTWATAHDLGPAGITVNAVCPGGFESRMIHAVREGARRDIAATGDSPDKRVVTGPQELFPPEALVPFVTYLCTGAADAINGQVFSIGGNRFGWYQPSSVAREIAKPDRWTVDELIKLTPNSLMRGVANPAPKKP